MSRAGGAVVFVLVMVAAAAQWLVLRECLDRALRAPGELADILALESACERYAANHAGVWPLELAQLVAHDSGGRSYLAGATVPRDRWGREFRYAPPESAYGYPHVWSWGRDGTPGGHGEDADAGVFEECE